MTSIDDRLVTLLNAALAMELKGVAFFEKARQDCANPTGQMIFDMLAQDERDHVAEIEALAIRLRQGEGWPEQPRRAPDAEGRINAPGDIRRLISGLASDHEDQLHSDPGDLEALRIGIDFERRVAAFYRDQLPGADDPLERSFLEDMIVEEDRHVALLSELKALLEDPATWMNAGPTAD